MYFACKMPPFILFLLDGVLGKLLESLKCFSAKCALHIAGVADSPNSSDDNVMFCYERWFLVPIILIFVFQTDDGKYAPLPGCCVVRIVLVCAWVVLRTRLVGRPQTRLTIFLG
jgi:hypothetical protein